MFDPDVPCRHMPTRRCEEPNPDTDGDWRTVTRPRDVECPPGECFRHPSLDAKPGGST